MAELLRHLAILVLPAPVIVVGALAGLGLLTWRRGLVVTAIGQLVATWLYLHFSDFAFACVGTGCQENWLLRGYLTFYSEAILAALIVSLVLIPVALRLSPKGAHGPPPA